MEQILLAHGLLKGTVTTITMFYKNMKAVVCLETMIDTHYADNLALLASAPAQAESLLHSLKQAVVGISLYMNANKMCFKQEGTISTLNGKSLKLVDQFTYPSRNISSTESDVNIGLLKVWTAIDWLSII